eukprot:jgi/Mesvir1/29054/Mv18362-RA.1
MGPVQVRCDNGGCQELGTKACGRCHAAYYCSRACQVSDFSKHKRSCQWAMELGKTAVSSVSLDEGAAKEHVTIAAQYLNEEDGTPGSLALAKGAFRHLQELAKSCENERLLGKAGACELFVRALDRAVTGDSRVPLDVIVGGMANLTKTSVKNQVDFGNRGAVDGITKALRLAVRDSRWELLESANACIINLTRVQNSKASACDQCGAAGTFEMVGQSVVVATCLSPGSPASYEACNAVGHLHVAATHCPRTQCHNARRLGWVPGIYAALDECLQSAVTSGDLASMRSVCGAMHAVTSRSTYPFRHRCALATPRVCQNLVRALQRAAPADGPLAALDDELCLDLCNIVSSLLATKCEVTGVSVGEQSETASRLKRACGPIVAIWRAANGSCQRDTSGRGHRLLQREAAFAVWRLATWTGNVNELVVAGACEEAAEALRQGVESEDESLQYAVLPCFSYLSYETEGTRRFATRKQVCELLVASVNFFVAEARKGRAVHLDMLSCLGVSWTLMQCVHPPCRGFFEAAGADAALERLKEVSKATGSRTADRW